MSKKVLSILLIISLAFNMAVIGGFIYRQLFFLRFHPKCPANQHIPTHFREEFEITRERIHPFRQDFMQCKKEFMEGLMNKDFNLELLDRKLKETLEKQMRMEHELGALLIRLRSEMSPEEAKRFFKPEFLKNRNIRDKMFKRRKQ